MAALDEIAQIIEGVVPPRLRAELRDLGEHVAADADVDRVRIALAADQRLDVVDPRAGAVVPLPSAS